MAEKLTPAQIAAIADRAETTARQQQIGRPFQKGQSGNPAGRPKSSRNKLGEAFIEAMQEDFAAHGAATIAAVRSDKPDQYLKVIAAILPKDLNINVNQFEAMSDDELIERLRTLDATIRPFLDAGEGGDSSGVDPQTTH